MRIFLASLKDLPPLEPEMLGLIVSSRRTKAMAYAKAEDQQRAILAGLMLREVLGLVRDDDMTIDPGGRPRLAGPGPNFSLSHSGPYVALSVGAPEHGLDIQVYRDKPVSRALLNWTLSPEEKSLFESNQNLNLFIQLWTMKEAYIKATGQGLARGLNTFSVLPVESGPRTIDGQEIFFHLSALAGAALSLASLTLSFPPLVLNLKSRLLDLIKLVSADKCCQPTLEPIYRPCDFKGNTSYRLKSY